MLTQMHAVIGERIVTPSAIVQLFVKARVTPPIGQITRAVDKDESASSRSMTKKTKNSLQAVRILKSSQMAWNPLASHIHPSGLQYVYKRGSIVTHRKLKYIFDQNRKPSWWVVIADHKSNKVVMPPMKITDVPISDTSAERNYRAYKLQFQAPQQVATFSWKVHVISDTFISEEVVQDLVVRSTCTTCVTFHWHL